MGVIGCKVARDLPSRVPHDRATVFTDKAFLQSVAQHGAQLRVRIQPAFVRRGDGDAN